jgi:hypothetical protein
MAQHMQLMHQALPVAASTTTPIVNDHIGGFFCSGAGTVTINGTTDQGAAFQVVSFTGVAGTWYTLPFYIGPRGGTIVTGAGATGTLAV